MSAFERSYHTQTFQNDIEVEDEEFDHTETSEKAIKCDKLIWIVIGETISNWKLESTINEFCSFKNKAQYYWKLTKQEQPSISSEFVI